MIGALHSSSAFYAPAYSRAGDAKADTDDAASQKAEDKQTQREQQAVDQEVQQLKKRDAEVRTHEQAHLSAASGISVSGPHFEMTEGPDGRQYVSDGHVSIDTSPAATPEATLDKARQIRAAALAPAQPSTEDMQVAAQATQMEREAQAALQAEKQEAMTGDGEQTPGTSDPEAAKAPGALETAHTLEAAHIAQCPDCQRKAFGLNETPEGRLLGTA
ncbi:MAG: hypothetical protein E1N59_1645 [Puniceicoccaceae bacterium 5H]|nr:MAG: hypothetical protein E1N59_1645 [Puniceicoccaceae bacterium 5H]